MLTIPLKKGSYHNRKQKIKSFSNHEEFLARIAKSLYYVNLPFVNYTSLPVTELASEIFSEVNKFSLNRLDIEKASHLSRNACVSPCLLVLALLYLERLKTSNPKYLTKVSPTELFLISLLVGSKFVQDDGEADELSNTKLADLTGLSVQEVNKAEKQFLNAINWDVFVSKEEFWNRFNSLEMKVGLRQGCKRGWFTYTELNLVLQLVDLTTVAQCFWNPSQAQTPQTASIDPDDFDSDLLTDTQERRALKPNSKRGWPKGKPRSPPPVPASGIDPSVTATAEDRLCGCRVFSHATS